MSIRSDNSRRVIVVTGLIKEARIAAGPGVHAIAGGGNAPALAAALERELARGAGAVMSFGIAGGLAEEVVRGTWLVARAIVTPAKRWPCDAAWARSIAERLPGAWTTDLAGVDAPVSEPAAKRELHRDTGAAAVDTESHIAAAIAAAHGLELSGTNGNGDIIFRLGLELKVFPTAGFEQNAGQVGLVQALHDEQDPTLDGIV